MKNNVYKLLLRKNFHKVCFLVVIIMASINSLVFSKIVLISGNVMNIYLKKSNEDLHTIMYKMTLLFIFWCLSNIFYYIFTNNFIEKNLSNIRNNILSIILNGDMYTLEKSAHTGSISLRSNSDIEKLEDILTGDLLWFLRVLMNALFSLINCIVLNYQLSLVFIIFPISFSLIKKISKSIRQRKRNSSGYIDNAMTLMLETFQGLPILKSFNLEERITHEFNKYVEKSKEENIKNEKTSLIAVAINYIIQVIQLAILLITGMFMIPHGYILPGTFISMILLSNNIRFAIRLLSDMSLCWHETTVLCERVLEIFNIDSEKKEGKNLEIHKINKVDCLDVENLSFKYDNKNILNGLSLKIKQGEKIAILGQSGCGKSTLIKLICGFYENYNGKINLYQNDIKNINKNSLRKQIAIVTQDVFVINGSIYENIVLDNKKVNEGIVLDIIKKCCLEDLIKSLPYGLSTLIGDGGINLSQGEKQRISIARAMLKNSPIVIMDEATSSLDYNTEENILSSFDYLLKNKTAIIITHKQNILKLADKKYIMQNGKLILS